MEHGVVHENYKMSYLVNDYSISCADPMYEMMYMVGLALIFLIPVGIPVTMGGKSTSNLLLRVPFWADGLLVFPALIWQHREDIANHEGPHHLEGLYSSYRPDCCLWEVYQMLEKVVLVGIITFIDRGSILQVLVGLILTNCMMISFVNQRPYLELKTNI